MREQQEQEERQGAPARVGATKSEKADMSPSSTVTIIGFPTLTSSPWLTKNFAMTISSVHSKVIEALSVSISSKSITWHHRVAFVDQPFRNGTLKNKIKYDL